jgi:leucyl aminopeptidase (aminopeptidase T)
MVPYERIAKTIVEVCARVQKGDNLYIRGREDTSHFCELIALACRNRGAYPIIEVLSDYYRMTDLKETPLHVITAIPQHVQALIQETDFVIYVGMQPKDPLPFRFLPAERLSAERQARKGITDIILEHPKKRWIGMAYPSKEQATLYSIDFEEFHDMVWKALDIDYTNLAERASYLHDVLYGSSVIHITNRKGTDVTFNIKGRPILKDDGIIDEEDIERGDKIINLPAGEVYTTPHEKETEGEIVFDFVFQKGASCGTLCVKVHHGQVYPLDDSPQASFFKEILCNSTGDKDIIGELGFGLNPFITKPVGHQLLDEKIIGTVHAALGENRSYGGKNQSDLHWDLIISEPTVEVDSKIIMDNGKYII